MPRRILTPDRKQAQIAERKQRRVTEKQEHQAAREDAKHGDVTAYVNYRDREELDQRIYTQGELLSLSYGELFGILQTIAPNRFDRRDFDGKDDIAHEILRHRNAELLSG